MLEQFLKQSEITDSYEFSFVPVGYNLSFEHNFFRERLAFHGLPMVDILTHPFIDLRACGIIMNKGEFKGSGLDKITGKPHDGSVVPEWYSNKEYDKIIGYIKKEAEEFTKFCVWLYKELPMLLVKYKEFL